jgi:hypothetical protein
MTCPAYRKAYAREFKGVKRDDGDRDEGEKGGLRRTTK